MTPAQTLVKAGVRVSWVDDRQGTSQIGELEHVRQGANETRITPLGVLAVYHAPALPEAAAHWKIECFLRSDIHFDGARPEVHPGGQEPNYPDDFLDDLLDSLLKDGVVFQPVWLNVHHGRNVEYRQRGKILDYE